ncbi:MAG TPA: hypothetical protein VN688_19725 [Gemmataceae bacterium]|nr:hypothetical protein [Gemmataceae bacterium]
MRVAFLAVGLLLALVLLGVVSAWIFVRGPDAAWTEFVESSNKWGNVASVVGLVLTVIGFSITFYGFRLTLGEQNRIRQAVTKAIERAASSVLSSTAEEVEGLLLEFKNAVRRGEWLRAGEKCDDAEARVARMLGNPHLFENEQQNLAIGVDDLRLVSRYITLQKTLKPHPAGGFHEPKLDKVDRLIATLRAIRARIHNRVWEV